MKGILDLDELISPDESITRFISQKTYFRPSNKTVRHNAFMPNRDGETSVYRIIGIDEAEIYEIGKEFYSDIIDKPLLGRADIVVLEILKHELTVEPEPAPHPRHANILNWPDEDEGSKRRLIAVQLAAEAQLHLIENPEY